MVRNNNNEIYGTTGANGYGVSIADVQTVLRTNDNDVYSLCENSSINPWAKYKPTPAAVMDTRNIPGALTDADREALNWGLTLAWDTASLTSTGTLAGYVRDLLNNAIKNLTDPAEIEAAENAVLEQLSMQKRAWVNGMFHRLSDFLSSDNKDYGYKHNAAIYNAEWKYAGETITFKMSPPLIVSSDRSNYQIEEGVSGSGEIDIPNDARFLEGWFDNYQEDKERIGGDNLSLSDVDVLRNADKWASSNLQGYDSLTGQSPRGAIILVKNPREDAPWDRKWIDFGSCQGSKNIYNSTAPHYNYIWENTPLDLQWAGGTVDGTQYSSKEIPGKATTTSTGYSPVHIVKNDLWAGYNDSDNSLYGYWIGNRPSSIPLGVTIEEDTGWKDLQGRCLFIEYYFNYSLSNPLPIPNYAYFVNITRVPAGHGSGDVNITGQLHLEFNENIANNEGTGIKIYAPSLPSNGSDVVTLLSTYYTALTVCLSLSEDGTNPISTINLLSSSSWSGYSRDSGTETFDGVVMDKGTMEEAFSSSYTGTGTFYQVIQATKVGGGTGSLAITLVNS